jgi:GcrA cell cycle regulator
MLDTNSLPAAWTPERVTTLRNLWSRGLSASQIAGELDTSRNAVLAKAWRLDLSRSAPAPKPRPQRDEAARIRDKTAAADIEAILAAWVRPGIDIARKPLTDLEADDCKWPVGEPGQAAFGFCACRRVAGAPYCSTHLNRSRATR